MDDKLTDAARRMTNGEANAFLAALHKSMSAEERGVAMELALQMMWEAAIAFCATREAEAQRWIPVSESLPSESDECLVTMNGDVWHVNFFDGSFHQRPDMTSIPIEFIEAWMPIPEPYKSPEADNGS